MVLLSCRGQSLLLRYLLKTQLPQCSFLSQVGPVKITGCSNNGRHLSRLQVSSTSSIVRLWHDKGRLGGSHRPSWRSEDTLLLSSRCTSYVQQAVLHSSCSRHDKVQIGPAFVVNRETLSQKFVSSCPARVQPYLRLSRVHQPIGTWLLFWPCTWGLALGASGVPDLSLLALFATGAFIMRGAGCTINDMWDRHIDKQVQRTLQRPLALGELRMRHATAWLAFQLSLAFSILLQLNHPCFIIGVGSLVLVTLYPLAKRVTNWPQAVLGSAFNIGVIMGFAASPQFKELGYLTFPWMESSCLPMYLAGVAWTLIYDTIYAHQGREEDATLGLGSTARRFGDKTKIWLSGFACVTVASLTTCAILQDLYWPFYASIAGVIGHFGWQITTLDINDAKNCSDRFRSNRHIGWLIFLGIMGSSIVSRKEANNNSSLLVQGTTKSKTSFAPSVQDHSNSDSSSLTMSSYTSQIKLKNT